MVPMIDKKNRRTQESEIEMREQVRRTGVDTCIMSENTYVSMRSSEPNVRA